MLVSRKRETKRLIREMAGDDSHDLMKLLGSSDRDFLIRNNGDQVSINIEYSLTFTVYVIKPDFGFVLCVCFEFFFRFY